MEIFDNLSDDDEEIIQFMEYERRPYRVRERENYFDSFDEEEFATRFRLRKETVLFILHLIEAELEHRTDRNHSISTINQLLLTLRYYATGSFMITVADFLKVSKSSASKIIKKVSRAIANLNRRFIKMPSNDAEVMQLQTGFYSKARLPRIIGSLDCTHIKIQSPGGNLAELYRNRKGYFSVNVQTIAAPNLEILDIVARWPGSTHDQIIFDNSRIKQRLENGEFGNSLLVADSGYANTMHVITPYVQAETEVKQMYNEAVTRTRNPVERQYGVWKRRFPVLALGLRCKLETTLTIIVAAAVLHNIALIHKEGQPPDELELQNADINFDEEINLVAENHAFVNAREFLINEYFPNLA